ncbi:hypothetical protein HMP0015_3029 [Acinetobacter haemolyticus ATCC 19194]|uniref:Uncharacterized protein n=1 Tax=Acinetobacter haemolyticus ATCC 19194 TaxID=707232 RepID=D4XTI7_ACIHA|nr:hypothetical protein HMP0015_3029 [Acinetobacter haemolyticus ATCC 19194]
MINKFHQAIVLIFIFEHLCCYLFENYHNEKLLLNHVIFIPFI